jgi:ribosomal protein L10
MLAASSGRCSTWSTPTRTHILSGSRGYAISVKPAKPLPGRTEARVFKDKKAFQYNWYTRILQNSYQAPLLFLHHDQFSANRLIKLRQDINAAAAKAAKKPSLASGNVIPPTVDPTLTSIRTSIFGAALRDFPGANSIEVEKMIGDAKGTFAVLSLPSFDPPQLDAILRTLERTVPPRPPKTPEELKKELAEKNADPATPGRRMKRQRRILSPELKLMGAIVEGKVFLPQGVKEVAKLPTLDTLRAQLVGLLSAPATQLAGVLSEAAGGRLARALEGLKKGLEEEASPVAESNETTTGQSSATPS